MSAFYTRERLRLSADASGELDGASVRLGVLKSSAGALANGSSFFAEIHVLMRLDYCQRDSASC